MNEFDIIGLNNFVWLAICITLVVYMWQGVDQFFTWHFYSLFLLAGLHLVMSLIVYNILKKKDAANDV